MATNLKPRANGKIAAKAQRLLAFAEKRAKQATDWVELHNALFGIGGKATELFATESERTAFSKRSGRLAGTNRKERGKLWGIFRPFNYA